MKFLKSKRNSRKRTVGKLTENTEFNSPHVKDNEGIRVEPAFDPENRSEPYSVEENKHLPLKIVDDFRNSLIATINGKKKINEIDLTLYPSIAATLIHDRVKDKGAMLGLIELRSLYLQTHKMKLGQPNVSQLRELDLKLVTFNKKENLDVPGTVKNIISKYGGNDNIFTGYFDDQIYAWQGNGWNFDAEGEIRTKLQHDEPGLSTREITEIIENLKNTTRDLTRHRPDTMQLPYGFFPVRNGIIDLKNGKCMEHVPNYLYERPDNVDYDPTAIPVKTTGFLLRRFASNPKGFFMVLEDFAASLAGRPYNQVIPIWMGKSVRDGFISGGEGKTTTAELLAMLHGKAKTSTMGYEDLAGSSFNLLDFHGKSLHILSLDEDTKNQEKFHIVSPAKLFERLRESELTVPVKHSNKSMVIVNPYHIIIGNTLPKLFSNTIASVRSLRKFVEFVDPMPSSEHVILSQFDEREKSGMLNLCMPIFRALQRRGKYYGESTLTEAKEKYSVYSDSITGLLENLFTAGEATDRIETSQVFQMVQDAIKVNDIIMTRPLSQRRLTDELRSLFGIAKPKDTTERRKNDNGESETIHRSYYIGIKKIDTENNAEKSGSAKG